MAKYTIGIDYGSLSGRAVLVDVADGRQLADCVMDYPHAVMSETLAATGAPRPPDFALQDPRDYLDVLHYIIPGAIKKAGVDPADIIGLGVDFTCCTLLPVRADGTPLCFEEKYRGNGKQHRSGKQHSGKQRRYGSGKAAKPRSHHTHHACVKQRQHKRGKRRYARIDQKARKGVGKVARRYVNTKADQHQQHHADDFGKDACRAALKHGRNQ